jgi:hypothetical protein
MVRRVRYKAGDVFAIPLGEGRFGFGRLFRDTTVAVFSRISSDITDVADLCGAPVAFYAAVFDTAIRSGEWPKIGECPFPDPDNAWPPPRVIEDILRPGTFKVYERGEIRRAPAEEVRSLDRALIYKPAQLVDRIRQELLADANG